MASARPASTPCTFQVWDASILYCAHILVCSIDLALPVNGSIDRNNPTWTVNLLNQYIETIDAFKKYDNVLAFNVGNEVITAPAGTGAAAFIKAAARDVKAYLSATIHQPTCRLRS